MEKERLHYVDIAKGLLILMVIYGHVDGTATELGFSNAAIDDIHKVVNIFVSFYMPCFFIITGFCSNFGKSFHSFFLSSIKTILLPAFVFSFILSGAWNIKHIENLHEFIYKIIFYGGSYWFLSALFLARIVYYVLHRWAHPLFIALFCFLSFIAGYFLSSLPQRYELWWFVHALCMLPYLGVGQILKQYWGKIDINKYYLFFIIAFIFIFFVTVVLARTEILQKDCFFDVPGVTQGYINLNKTMLVPLVLLSVLGSLSLLGFSYKVAKNKCFEFLGRNSLVIYCVQGITLSKTMTYISRMWGTGFGVDYWTTLLLLLLSFFVAVLICALIAWVMNMKYLRIAIGKF